MLKRICLCFIVAWTACTLSARDIAGRWVGTLTVQGFELHLAFRIQSDADGRLSALLDSPDQGATGILCDAVTFDAPRLTIAIPAIVADYEATLRGDTLDGFFTQAGMRLPLLLTPGAEEEPRATRRPQEPQPPYPYRTEEVRFVNPIDGDTLAGTLTLPDAPGPHPAVVLISGSGAQDRDETLMDHKPFLVWADALTRRGIAVLRYDDRGTAASTGDFATATTVDFSRDTESALDFLRSRADIDARRTGLMGHSEGGLIAPMVAARRPADVAFLVLLAAPGVRGDSLLMRQSEDVSRLSNEPDSVREADRALNRQVFALLSQKDPDEEGLRQALAEVFRQAINDMLPSIPHEQVEPMVAAQVEQLVTPWMRHFVCYDPAPTLRKVSCPVLAVNGGKDVQVAAEVNLPAIRRALEAGGNKRIRTVELPGLNHLFQPCVTCRPEEYGTIRETVSPDALRTVIDAIVEMIAK